jgi:hypothetical protein
VSLIYSLGCVMLLLPAMLAVFVKEPR